MKFFALLTSSFALLLILFDNFSIARSFIRNMKQFKLIILLITFLVLSKNVHSQRESDFGFSGGGAYYMGDINPFIPFYSPKINLGFVYRYNLNPHYVLKLEGNYLRLAGNDADFDNEFQKARGASFNTAVSELTGQFEFNFLPLKFKEKRTCFTPYISGGAGYAFGISQVVVPFALGVKVSYSLNWTFGLGWNFRKTSTDELDNKTVNLIPDTYKSSFNNNDWYAFANIFVTYKIFDFTAECPAYMKTY